MDTVDVRHRCGTARNCQASSPTAEELTCAWRMQPWMSTAEPWRREESWQRFHGRWAENKQAKQIFSNEMNIWTNQWDDDQNKYPAKLLRWVFRRRAARIILEMIIFCMMMAQVCNVKWNTWAFLVALPNCCDIYMYLQNICSTLRLAESVN